MTRVLSDLSWTELETLAMGHPSEAVNYCSASLAENKEPVVRVNLLRAMALAHRGLGQSSDAFVALREAATIAATLSDPVLIARVDMSLSVLLVLNGQPQEGFALLRSDRADLDPATRSMIEIQRAGLLARVGQLHESLAAFASAFKTVPSDLPVIFEADGRSNRAIALALSGQLGRARGEFERAKSLFESEGVAHGVADCLLNLGWIAGLTGNVPLAFQCFDEAELRHSELGIPTAVLAQHRCDTFISAGLGSEAKLAAERALQMMTDAPPIERAEALIRLARAALADGDLVRAADAAASAIALAPWLSDDVVSRAQMLEIEARRRAGLVARADLDALLARIGAAESSRGKNVTLLASELRLDAAMVAQTLGEHALARAMLDSIDHQLLSMPQRMAATLVHARLHDAAGNAAGRTRALTRGQALLARHRAAIGATELRVHVAVHATELAAFGLDHAFRSGRPARVLEWVEFSRSPSLHASRSVRSRDEVLEGLLDELRVVLDQLGRAVSEGRPSPELARRRDTLQRAVMLRSRQESAHDGGRSGRFRLAELRSVLADRVFISLIDHQGEMFATVVTESRSRLARIGRAADVRLEMDRLRRACSRTFTAVGSSRAVHASVVEDCSRRADDLLFGPLRLADRPVVLSPPPSLHAAPWACLPSLSERPFVVAPSASTWLSSGVPAASGPATLVAGPSLRFAKKEIELLASIHRRSMTLKGTTATCANVLAALEGASLAHIACHGSFTADQAMLSGLELADGRLTVYDIERLAQPPPIFVITACQGGRSAEHPGEELMGLTSALVALGVHHVIASGLPVPDDERTLGFIEAMHRQLAEGAAPPDALQLARSSTADRSVAGSFTCFGRRGEVATR